MREELLRIAFQLEHDGVFGLSRAIEKLRALAAQCGEPSAPPSQPVARTCTCHPDDSPPRPCAQHYALDECRKASQPVALPPGWVAVPREPTLEMLLAEDAAIPSRDEDDDAFAWGRVGWAAMLAAAPKPEEIADFRCADGRKSGCQCIPEIGCNSASAPEVPRG